MLTALTFVADRGLPGGGMRHDGPRWWGLVLMMAVLAAAVLLTWFVARRRPMLAAAGAPPVAAVGPVASPTASAESILAERLARSEITPDDYRTLLQALRGGTSSPVPPPPASGEPTPPAS